MGPKLHLLSHHMIFERRELDQSIDDLLSAVGWNVNTDVGQHQKQKVRMNYIKRGETETRTF
jgi:hypothetical protein